MDSTTREIPSYGGCVWWLSRGCVQGLWLVWLRTRGEYIQPKTETETELHQFSDIAQ